MQNGPKLSFGVFHTAPSLFGQSVLYLFIGALSDIIGVADPRPGEEGNYHSGPGGYTADYGAEQGNFDEGNER